MSSTTLLRRRRIQLISYTGSFQAFAYHASQAYVAYLDFAPPPDGGVPGIDAIALRVLAQHNAWHLRPLGFRNC
jgi:hypothetical protein